MQICRIKIYRALLLCLLIFSILLADDSSATRPKIGLALSGGGALGMAHVGLLKKIDSLNIPIDYIAGTSMGGIVGALYAIGYSGAELEGLALRINWEDIFDDKLPREQLPFFEKVAEHRFQFEIGLENFRFKETYGLIAGHEIQLLLAQLTQAYLTVSDFDSLPIPFRCMAVDLVSGNLVVLEQGSLPKAMRATMSIPSAFIPVTWGDSLLIDGGLLNNLPTNILKEMGADIIIASAISFPKKSQEDLRSPWGVLAQSFSIARNKIIAENAQLADVYIRCVCDNLTPADFAPDKVRRIINIGNRTARDNTNQLIAMIQQYQLDQYPCSPLQFDPPKTIRIDSITVGGNLTYSDSMVIARSGIDPPARYCQAVIDTMLVRLHQTDLFSNIDYHTRSLTDSSVLLQITVAEKKPPVIYSVDIRNNQELPFDFIYNLLGIKPGNRFTPERIEERINHLYSLGYFRKITYALKPVKAHHVRLIVTVEEESLSRLRVGLRYDNQHQLVAAINYQFMNFIVPGLRYEEEVQLFGLNRFIAKLYYPSRTLDIPIYPYLQGQYKNIPIRIYNQHGQKVANYYDRGVEIALGIGFQAWKSINMELEYTHEYINSKPDIVIPDSTLFPSWKDQLHKFYLSYKIDHLDNYYASKNGYLISGFYENSNASYLYSDRSYSRYAVSADWYKTFWDQYTVHLNYQYGTGSANLPLYKYFFCGGAHSFVGVRDNQLMVNTLSLLRLDLVYRLNSNILIKSIANRLAFDILSPAESNLSGTLMGYGIGLQYNTAVGPLDLIIGRGPKDIIDKSNYQILAYFTAGYEF